MDASAPLCIVVDAYSSGNLLSEAFQKRGFRTLHVKSRPTIPEHFLQSYSAKSFSDKEIVNTRSLGATANNLRRMRPSLFVAGCETGVEAADYLSEALGLPSNGVRLSSARRDKFKMIEAVKRTGLATVEHLCSRSLREIEHWSVRFLRRNEPVVIKPRRSAGSDRVRICRTREEVRHASISILGKSNQLNEPDRDVVAQSFLPGTEFFVDVVSCNGEPHAVDVSKYRKHRMNGRDGVYDCIELRSLVRTTERRVIAYALDVARALGIRHGPAHIEIMLTPKGPVLVELGARLAGVGWPLLVEKCTQYGPVKATVDAYLAALPGRIGTAAHARFLRGIGSLTRHRHGRLVFGNSSAEGQLVRAPTLPSRLATNRDLPCRWIVDPGHHPLQRTVDAFTFPLLVYLCAASRSHVDKDHRTLRKWERMGMYQSFIELKGALSISENDRKMYRPRNASANRLSNPSQDRVHDAESEGD
jgi:hypothetical protein